MAGILFMLPGFLTDIFALLLLLPPVSVLVEKLIKSRVTFFSSKIFRKTDRTFYGYDENSEIFDVEFEKRADEDKRIK